MIKTIDTEPENFIKYNTAHKKQPAEIASCLRGV